MALKEIPDRYLGVIIHFLMNFHNDTSEFSRPHMRKSFQQAYKFLIFFYFVLMLAGLVSNVLLIRRLYILRISDVLMYRYLAFNAFNDIIKSVVVLPLALLTTLYQNWVYGSFLCYLFPMIQDIPFHMSMLTFLLIAFDRYRQILYPLKEPFSTFLCIVGVLIVTIFAVLPYAVYTRYLDLEIYFGIQFKGTGICAINVDDNIEEYIRGLFIIMYVLPLGLVAFLHVKASEEIKSRQTSFTVSFRGVGIIESRENDSVSSLNPNAFSSQSASRVSSSVTLTVPKEFPIQRDRGFNNDTVNNSEDNKDWNTEMKLQRFLVMTVGAYASCLLPLNLVRLFKHVVYETYENSLHFDITFVIVVWLAFLTTVTTPLIFHYWHRSGVHNLNISRYLRLVRTSDVSFSAYDVRRKENLPTTNPSNE